MVTLYTIFPNKLAVKSIEKWNKIKTLTDIPKTEFVESVDTTLHSHTYFAYNDTFYK